MMIELLHQICVRKLTQLQGGDKCQHVVNKDNKRGNLET